MTGIFKHRSRMLALAAIFLAGTTVIAEDFNFNVPPERTSSPGRRVYGSYADFDGDPWYGYKNGAYSGYPWSIYGGNHRATGELGIFSPYFGLGFGGYGFGYGLGYYGYGAPYGLGYGFNGFPPGYGYYGVGAGAGVW